MKNPLLIIGALVLVLGIGFVISSRHKSEEELPLEEEVNITDIQSLPLTSVEHGGEYWSVHVAPGDALYKRVEEGWVDGEFSRFGQAEGCATTLDGIGINEALGIDGDLHYSAQFESEEDARAYATYYGFSDERVFETKLYCLD